MINLCPPTSESKIPSSPAFRSFLMRKAPRKALPRWVVHGGPDVQLNIMALDLIMGGT